MVYYYYLLFRCTFSIFVLHFKSTVKCSHIFKLLYLVDVAIFNLQFDVGIFLFLTVNDQSFLPAFLCDLFNTVQYEHLILLIFRPHKINSSIVSSSFTFIIRLIQRPGFYVQRTYANLSVQLKFPRPGEKDVITFQKYYRSVLFYELPSIMNGYFL